MGTKSVYDRQEAVDDDGDDYVRMIKYTVDLEPAGSYDLRTSASGQVICTCPARTQTCRHVRMDELFLMAALGEDESYNAVARDNPDHNVFLQTDASNFKWVVGIAKDLQDG